MDPISISILYKRIIIILLLRNIIVTQEGMSLLILLSWWSNDVLPSSHQDIRHDLTWCGLQDHTLTVNLYYYIKVMATTKVSLESICKHKSNVTTIVLQNFYLIRLIIGQT